MNHKSIKLLILFAIATFSFGCLSTNLPERDRDMSENELNYYKNGGQYSNYTVNGKPMTLSDSEFIMNGVDMKNKLEKDLAWIPLIRLAFTKIDATESTSAGEHGYKAKLFNSYGPLFLLRAKSQDSTYDSQGKLQTYKSSSGYLWGILCNSESEQKKIADKWQTEDSNSFILGLFKYTSRNDSADTLRLFYIPFDISK